MDKTITIYNGALGLNNKIVPHRLPYDENTGVDALEEATDVVIDKTGEILSRRGTALSAEGVFHSMYKLNDESFYIVKQRSTDSALYRAVVDSSGTVTLNGIRSDLARTKKMSYFILADKVYYSNGVDRGQLSFDESTPWPVSDWTGPESKVNFGVTPIGEHIELFNGRAIVSVDDELFYTEYGLLGLVDLVRNRRRFESRIIMIKSVQSGLFVSDEKSVWFLSGKEPKKWTADKVLDYPAVEFSCVQGLVTPLKLGIESDKLSCVFGTTQGPVVGLPDGSVINLIDKNVTMPQSCGCTSGAIMVVDETMIIQSGE